MNATLKSWARALGGEVCGEQVLCPGPGHSPSDRSLSITIGKDGQPVVYSHAGDDWQACLDHVRKHLGMEPWKRKTAYSYEFRDPTSGDVKYRKERVERADGTKEFYLKPSGRNGSGPLLYGGERLSDISSMQPVFVVEGEKKVDRLREFGAIAVSADSGSSSKWLPAHADLLRGLNVVLWPDSDEPGEKYISHAAKCLRNSVASLRVVRPFGPPNGAKGRDVCDWEGNAENLAVLAANAELFFDGESLEIVTRCASDITPEPISWLWKYWIARGKLHIIGGVPETGKTTIAMSYAAIISSVASWPDGTRAISGNVLVWTSEDNPADTLIPRLIRMGADLKRIHFIEQARPPNGKLRPFSPATDMCALVAKAKTIGDVVLLILDPVVAAIPMTRDSHKNAETRNSLQPVVDFAEAANIAVLGIGHLTKGTAGKDPLERLNGSLAFGALPRIVMGAAKNEVIGDDEPERIMVRIKSNIGPSGGGFGYHIDMALLHERPDIEATRIVWEYPLEGTARELLDTAEGDKNDKVPKLDQAKRFLTDFLANTKRESGDVENAAKDAGMSWATVRRAAKEINVHKFREKDRSWWTLT